MPPGVATGAGFLRVAKAGSLFPLLMDTLTYYSDTLGWQQLYYVKSRYYSYGNSGIHLRHDNAMNAVFSDGHAEAIQGQKAKDELEFYNGYSEQKEELVF